MTTVASPSSTPNTSDPTQWSSEARALGHAFVQMFWVVGGVLLSRATVECQSDVASRIAELESNPRTAAKLIAARQRMAAALLQSGAAGSRDASELTILRLRAGLSQAQVAELMETKQANISRLENGQDQDPKISTLYRLAAVLKVEPAEVFTAFAPQLKPYDLES